ncbi:branched-chain amino acid ABC transporter permease [Comamonadaceae bacterium OH2545_COT-014]|nr:branched-chain amino acid ABC transporter permease [Comamonadaceae bacterium OH2545_COT-014]
MELLLISLLNGLSYGLLLFMLSAGLTLIFSLMGVLNFAHASFYMLGAYLGWQFSAWWGFGTALWLAPLAVGLAGALFERQVLRRVHAFGHVPELLVTFGLAYVVLEAVQLVWGRAPLDFAPPAWLQGPAFTLVQHPGQGWRVVAGAAPTDWCQQALAAGARVGCTPFPATRAFMAAVSLGMLAGLWLLLARTRVGLVIQAALTHPDMAQALGHNVPRVFMGVFGVGTALAGLAGVIGGSTFVTEPAMAHAVGPIIFVVAVIGGLGSLGGAFAASLLIGVMQTLAVSVDASLLDALRALGLVSATGAAGGGALWRLTLAQVAPVLPYLLLVAMLALRPQGLRGRREVFDEGA